MIPAAVRYLCASSADEALEALADPDAKVLAGGQSLLSVMKLRVVRPSLLVDIGRLGLGGVEARDGEIGIGALATWDELARAPELRRPALVAIGDCAAEIGDLQVRNRGTLGGSLAHADPASDMPAVVLALGGRLLLYSPEGERTVEAADFFVGPFTTELRQSELILEVVVPTARPGSGSAYVKVEHPASGFALAGAAALVRPDGSSAVALTGVGGKPILLPDGDPVETLDEVEVFGDHFAPVDYRRHLAGVVVRRALELARMRAKEDR